MFLKLHISHQARIMTFDLQDEPVSDKLDEA